MVQEREKSGKSVIILAAGNGSRMKSAVPKVFHKIGGLALLDHVIKAASEISADEIVTVLKPEYEGFQSEICSVTKAFQKVPTGTGDTVKFGLEKLQSTDSGWVHVLFGDIPLVTAESLNAMYRIASIGESRGDSEKNNTAVVILAFDSSGAENLGQLEKAEKDGCVKRIVEAKDISAGDRVIPLCNAGLLIRRDILNTLIDKIEPSPVTGEVYITEIVRLAYEKGYDCRYYEASKEELSGANTRAEFAMLERYFQSRMRRKFLDEGVTLVAPETVFFSYDTEIERDAVVYPYVVFGKNVKVKSEAKVGPFCVVEGAEIRAAEVGPFSRLRPGSEIDDGAKIGNFVEVKNSLINANTKVNHLSYIGDSDVGSNTNIGAGTITCNYDGFKKYRTDIGKNVFIGSNSALVAPVKVEDGAIVGAGSVITKDVERGSLAVARGLQRNVENWAENFRKSKDK